MKTRWRRGVRAAACLVIGAVLPACVAVGCGDNAAPDLSPPDKVRVGEAGDVYVSLGDSYAAGYTKLNAKSAGPTENGFAYQLVSKAALAGRSVQLVNFGCAGQTSTQLVAQDGCAPGSLAPGAPTYSDQPQAEAAVGLLTAHRDQVKLITVVIGGNDVEPCLAAADPASCVRDRLPALVRNLNGLLGSLRAAAPQARIIGLTYPDAVLGAWVRGDAASRRLAVTSQTLVRDGLNPALRRAYLDHGATFVDITKASGGYGSLQQMTVLEPYGRVPTPVARVCQLTSYCTYGDVHATVEGYSFIADQVLSAAGVG